VILPVTAHGVTSFACTEITLERVTGYPHGDAEDSAGYEHSPYSSVQQIASVPPNTSYSLLAALPEFAQLDAGHSDFAV
jgi:hypothetical protein